MTTVATSPTTSPVPERPSCAAIERGLRHTRGVPELPEVETVRRQLEPLLTGSVVVDAWAFPSQKFTDAPAAVGNRITGVRRRGKYLLTQLEPARDGSSDLSSHRSERLELVIHLGMTGRLSIDRQSSDRQSSNPRSSDQQSSNPHLRARWLLDDGRSLQFVDVRRFGRVAVVQAGEYSTLPTLAALGPEPWDPAFTGDALRTYVNSRRRYIKTLLLSQRPVAGVGNIYADEALWRAGVHPASRHLTRRQADELADAVRAVLSEGVEHGGTTLRDYRDAAGSEGDHQHHLDCYGRGDEPCPRCGTLLRRTIVDARGTTFCPTCQRR